ncbi:MAG: PspA/IM30 family protein [Defluviitaleaceae bacterium]|nr:PspA/IM30 family protein [Defluviitaleaceae bacterium]MCL2276214.1 PspA/IM30 family protein [Defluviitaleaceae bacterium]
MGILTRFTDIIAANVNAVFDKAEDPAKLIDQYLRKANDELAEVKKETAGVMAEESRTRRLVEENEKESARQTELARRALLAGNENDAKVFLQKKQEIAEAGAGLKLTHAVANDNAVKMRQMHDKLAKDINALNNKRQMIKAKTAVATATNRVNKISTSNKGESAISAFERMESKANRMLDEANAHATLNEKPIDKAQELEEKYLLGDFNDSVNDELAAMKAQLGVN